MNFLKLKYFLITAEELNISRAAERLYITQQALSSQISQLEQHYGVRLFQRKPVFELTWEGRCLQQRAQKILYLEQSFMDEILPSGEHCSGMVRIGYSSEGSRLLLSRLLPLYHKEYPQVRLELLKNTASLLHEQLLSGQLDFIIDYNAFCAMELSTITLLSEPLVLLADTKISRSDVKNYLSSTPLLLPSKEHYIRKLLDRFFRSMNLAPEIQMESNDFALLFSLCRSGPGAMFCPESYLSSLPEVAVSREDSEPVLYPVSLMHPDTYCRYTLEYASSRTLSPAESAWIHCIKKFYPAQPS